MTVDTAVDNLVRKTRSTRKVDRSSGPEEYYGLLHSLAQLTTAVLGYAAIFGWFAAALWPLDPQVARLLSTVSGLDFGASFWAVAMWFVAYPLVASVTVLPALWLLEELEDVLERRYSRKMSLRKGPANGDGGPAKGDQ